MSDIPVMMADNSAFTCMDVWQDYQWGDTERGDNHENRGGGTPQVDFYFYFQFVMSNIHDVGTVLIIEQAVGHCDGNEARTEMFRTSHQDSKGNIVFQEIELWS